MSKNLEELKELNEEDLKGLRLQDVVMYYLVPVLEDQENRLKKIEAWVKSCYKIDGEFKELKVGKASPGIDFEKRLKTVEAELGIYTEEEIKNIHGRLKELSEQK